LQVTPPTPPGTVAEACTHLVDHLPSILDGLHSRVVSPRSPLTHAWGKPPVVMRCGVPKPPGFDPASNSVATVDGVAWFQQVDGDVVRWTAVRRDVNVELAVPTSYQAQGGYLVDLAAAIKATIP
jgi:hypothetical protein